VFCSQVLDENLEAFINFIEAGIDSLRICPAIGACAPDRRIKGASSVRVRHARTPKRVVETPVGPRGDIQCDIAQTLISDLEKLLNETIELDVESLIAQLCDPQPYSLAVFCEEALDMNIEVIIALLEVEIDGFRICQGIGLCPGSQSRSGCGRD
jgi:hypothetical protein